MLNPLSLYQFRDEQELLTLVHRLKENFTTKRENIGDYLQDEKLVSAYFQFYAMTNMPKWQALLKRLPVEIVAAINAGDFVDFGCGPGTFSHAYLENGKGNVFCIDKSELMLKQAKKFLEGTHSDKKINYFNNTSVAPKTNGKSTLFFGHSLNEMDINDIFHTIKIHNPEFIIFIEPGTKEVFDLILQVRAHLVAQNYNILYPCQHTKTCPVANSEDWCHQYFKVSHEMELERLTQKAQIDRRNFPVIAHVYSKSFTVQNDAVIISEYPAQKHMKKFDLCTSRSVKIEFECSFRGLNGSEKKQILNYPLGERVDFAEIKAVNPQLFRGKLKTFTQE